MFLPFNSIAVVIVFAFSVSAQGPIIQVPPGVNGRDPYCWLNIMGIQNLNSTDCNRECVFGAPRRVCVYRFVLEQYHAMGSACGDCYLGNLQDCLHPQCVPGDGTERGLVSINRRRIGPDIQVCRGDILAINVVNQMGGAGATLHWHGILQRGTQYMDGVPKITQCPIPEASAFRYVFPVEDPGTFFYHSHTGFHKTNGHNGALIVRQPRLGNAGTILEPNWSLYTEDRQAHVILLTDYMHETAEMFFPGLPTRPPGIAPVSFLINGLGRFRDNTTGQTTLTPLATFHVQQGGSYRFRLINGGSMVCPMQFGIEGHNLTVISTDGNHVRPRVVDAIVTLSGERVDFIVNANQASTAYWIFIRGLLVCEDIDQISQVGVLSYDTAEPQVGIYPQSAEPTMANPLPVTTLLNHPQAVCRRSPSNICISELDGFPPPNPNVLTTTAVNRYEVDVGRWEWTRETLHGTAANPDTEYNAFQQRDRTIFESALINGISNEFPADVSLVSRYYGQPVPNSCNREAMPARCAPGGFCRCVHIVELEYQSIIELIFRDVRGEMILSHPFHTHGYKFYVMELVNAGQALSMNGTQSQSGIPPTKDTLLIPQGGAARVRMVADNPGDWLVHCHFEWHMAIGMSLVIRIPGPIPPPPLGFPACGNFDPISPLACLIPYAESELDSFNNPVSNFLSEIRPRRL